MNIVIAGGSGFVGRALSAALRAGGHRVTVLSRNPRQSAGQLGSAVTIEAWNSESPGTWERVLRQADAIVNLAGAPIADARWTVPRKQTLVMSRVGPTRLLVQSMSRLTPPCPILINASGVGFYGPRDDRPVNESTSVGTGFLADLCVAWEREAQQAIQYGTRVVLLRFGMVLDRDGGALPRMLAPFRAFVGGPVGPGHQWVSWIHRQDVVGLIQWILTASEVAGPVNAVAPMPVTMREFCRTLGHVLHRPSWLPVPQTVLRIALGELGTVLTTGQRVEPQTALGGGYVFRFPELRSALDAILHPPAIPRPRPHHAI